MVNSCKAKDSSRNILGSTTMSLSSKEGNFLHRTIQSLWKSPEKKPMEVPTINDFPDELLLKIMSFLRTKDVVATTVLSKQYRCLVNQVNTFRFDGTLASRDYSKFKMFISKRSFIDSLSLKLNPPFIAKDINSLVNVSMERSLIELRIEMLYGNFEMPETMFSITSNLGTLVLEKLSLVDIPVNASLVSLKKLSLLSVKFSGDEAVKMLLSVCLSLEEVVVRRSSYTNVKMFCIDVGTLTSLCIDNTSGTSRPQGVHGFRINTPLLRRFSIKDKFSNCLRFGDMLELVNASVNVVYHDQLDDKFLGSLASTKCLSLCTVTSQIPHLPVDISFLSLDCLELCSCSADWWNLLTVIMNNAPRLRVLKLNLFRKHCVQDDTMVPFNQLDYVPECLSSHLEIFEWRQYNGTEQERKAATYILANAHCLENATFYSESEEKDEMLKVLECVARGSKTCKLVFE